MSTDPTTSSCSHGEFKHFKTAFFTREFLLAGFDYFGKSVNVLNVESMSEWQKIVLFAEQSSAVKGVVLVSLKEGNFCAGADLEQMHDAQQRRSFQEMEQLVITAHRLFDAMEDRRNRFVAAVEGCLFGRWTRAGAGLPHANCQHPSEDLFCSARSQTGHSSWVRRHSTSPEADWFTSGIGNDHDGEDGFSPAGSTDGPCRRDGDLDPLPRQDSGRGSKRSPRSSRYRASLRTLLSSYPTTPSPGEPAVLEPARCSCTVVSLRATAGHQAGSAFLSGSAPCHRCSGERDACEHSGRIAHGRKASPSGSHGQPDFLTPRWAVPGRGGGETAGCHGSKSGDTYRSTGGRIDGLTNRRAARRKRILGGVARCGVGHSCGSDGEDP